jgi:hypothetical protein
MGQNPNYEKFDLFTTLFLEHLIRITPLEVMEAVPMNVPMHWWLRAQERLESEIHLHHRRTI